MSLEKKLSKAAKEWKKARERKPDYDNVLSDGVYTAKLVKAELGESRSKGRLQVAFGAVIASGEYKGEKHNWWSGLETEDNMMYFQRDLARLGKEVPDDPTELEDVLGELEKEKPTIKVKLITKGEYQNTRILKLVGEDEDEEVGVDEEEAEEPEEEEEEEEKEEESNDEDEEKAEKSDDEDDEEEAEEKDEKEDDSEEEEEDDSDEEEKSEEEVPEVEVGSRVMFSKKGRDIVGTVKNIDYKNELVKIKTDEGEIHKVAPDVLSPAPKAKVKKLK